MSWLVLATSCSWWVPDELVAQAKDRDDDGFAAWQVLGTDCDDSDPDVNPAAREVCDDGVDNNCDERIDDVGDGNVVWFRDDDLDGFGVPTDTRQACPGALTGLGWARTPDDCDDNDASAWPGAPDLGCDGVDNNCDGTPDSDNLAFDTDGDGFGVHPSLTWCADCNDDDAVVYPRAPELCDQRDNDCDDDVDEGALPTVRDQAYATLAEAVEGSLADVVATTLHVCPGTYELPTAQVHAGADLTIRGWPNEASSPSEVRVSEPDGNQVFLVAGGRLRLQNLVISESRHQAAVHLTQVGTLEIEDCVISSSRRAIDVRADDAGGVTILVVDTDIRDHDAGGGQGGGLYLSGGFDLTVRGGQIRDNEAFEGGGLYLTGQHGVAQLEDVEITGNTATNGGGVAAVRFGAAEAHGQISLTDVLLSGNTATAAGGGVWLEQYDLVGSGGAVIRSNQASGSGGGVSMLRSVLRNVDIADNVASQAGGGVHLRFASSATSSRSRLESTTIRGNTGALGCGLVVQSPEDPLVVDSCVIRDHSCGAPAAYVSSGSLQSVSTDWSNNSSGHLDAAACGPCTDPLDGVQSFVFP